MPTIGDHVRLSVLKKTFTREYDERWTGEVFKIASRSRRDGLDIYRLKDFNDEAVSGTFYRQELQVVNVDPNTVWKIDKIVKTRKRKGLPREHLVRWLHWPSKFDSWIEAGTIQDY